MNEKKKAQYLIERHGCTGALMFANEMIDEIWKISSKWEYREALWHYWEKVRNELMK